MKQNFQPVKKKRKKCPSKLKLAWKTEKHRHGTVFFNFLSVKQIYKSLKMACTCTFQFHGEKKKKTRFGQWEFIQTPTLHFFPYDILIFGNCHGYCFFPVKGTFNENGLGQKKMERVFSFNFNVTGNRKKIREILRGYSHNDDMQLWSNSE